MLASTCLSFICSGYVWQEGKDGIVKVGRGEECLSEQSLRHFHNYQCHIGHPTTTGRPIVCSQQNFGITSISHL